MRSLFLYNHFMSTQKLYLDDSYLKEVDAHIIEVVEDSPNNWRAILDKTVFYPMGGGQPTDQGIFTAGECKADIYQVMMKDGDIWHYGKGSVPKVSDTIHAQINWDRRYKNMRVHSGGHVIDFAIYQLGYSPIPLMPHKGDHGKKPYIMYQGVVSKDIKQEVEDKANELVAKNLEFSWYFQPLEALQKEAIYLQPGLPVDKPLRTLKLEGVGAVADGGTQVKKTGEVGKIAISQVETVGSEMTIVHYAII